MKKIWKYDVPISERFEIEMPYGAKILSFQMQNGAPRIWALVNPYIQITERQLFHVVGTGHEIDVGGELFIGTVQLRDGTVWHLFSVLP